MKKFNENKAYTDIEAELIDGEEVVWVGKPDPLRYALRDKDLFLKVVFFCLSYLVNFLYGRNGHYLSLIDVILLITLVYSLRLVSVPLWEYVIATRTIYAITDRRVLIISGFLKRSTQAFRQYQIQFIDSIEYPNGTGDVIFRRDPYPPSHLWSGFVSDQGNNNTTFETGFFGIQNPSHVEAIMLKTFTFNQTQSRF